MQQQKKQEKMRMQTLQQQQNNQPVHDYIGTTRERPVSFMDLRLFDGTDTKKT